MRTTQTHREIADQVRIVLGVLGIYLLIFGVAASAWAVRAAIGQTRYESLLMHPREPEQELSLARRSFRAYAWNYAICIRAADTAFKAAEMVTDPEIAGKMWREADYWVGRGLDLNPRLMELHYLKARMLARHSPEAATVAWKAYSDWHFWEPRNLEILGRFQEMAGRDEEALKTVELLKSWPAYDSWRTQLESRIGTQAGNVIPPARSEPVRP